jgi:hypothetical protein
MLAQEDSFLGARNLEARNYKVDHMKTGKRKLSWFKYTYNED